MKGANMRILLTDRENRLRTLLSILLLSLVAGTPLARGQGSAYLTGFVRDTSGSVVPGAAVVIRNVNTGIEYNAVSNDTGVYRSQVLPPGTYDVTFKAAGFQSQVEHGVEVQLGQARGL